MEAVFRSLMFVCAIIGASLYLTVRALEKSSDQLKVALAAQQRAARQDPLTGLANRVALTEWSARLMGTARPARLFLIDLDGFKAINDRFGHGTGDEILMEVAARLRDVCPTADIIVRLGGDEFLVGYDLAHATPPPDLGRQLVDRLVFTRTAGPISATVTASVGRADRLRDGDTLSEVMQTADERLYRAKAGGRQRCVDTDAPLTGMPSSARA